MNERILLAGDNPEARCRLLYDWQTASASSEKALERLQSESFDAVVIGQSVHRSQAAALIEFLGNLRAAPAILLIRHSDDRPSLNVETDTVEQHWRPGWLRERVTNLLLARRSLYDYHAC